RILTINVWSGLDYSGYLKMGEYETAAVREQRYQALVTQIKQLDPDLIGIQEANKLPDYAERLAKDTGYEVFFHMGVGGLRLGPVGLPWNLREGDALLAKKILQPQFAGRKKLSGGYVGNWAAFHFSDATQVIAVKIAVRNRPLYIFVTHWHASLLGSPGVLKKARELSDTGEASQRDVESVLEKIAEGVKWRLSESKKTVAFIQETADEHPFILMGDFNAESGSEEITQLLQFGMVDLFHTMNPNVPGFTWDPGTNLNHHQYYLKEEISGKDSDLLSRLKKLHTATPKRIDYIFLGPADLLASWKVSIKSSSVVMDEVINGAHASDHYGVFAEIEFRE
ncbi:MAG: hypothetical protein ACE5IR_26180, partial [bacterium]